MRRVELMELVSREGADVERQDVGHPHEGLPIGAVFPDFELEDLGGLQGFTGRPQSRTHPSPFHIY
jgi:hypothetical protein